MPHGTVRENAGDAPTLEHVDPIKREKVEALVEGLIFTDETVQKIRNVFEEEMNLGLAINPPTKSSLQMANTFIPELPDGTETGEYLALDLGGTNFRVILLELESGRLVKEEVKYFHVAEHLRLGIGEALFDFLASCIHQFMEEHKLLDRKFSLGFTFSFPMYQKSLKCGILVSWTKSFNCEGVVGQDVVSMLNDAIQRRKDLNVDVIAVLNDTTGTLIQGAYLDKNVAIGLIIGTGSNACYIEKIDRILNWDGPKPEKAEEVLIDIEWGAFGDNGVLDFIKTEYDLKVDNSSLLPNSFTFEKYYAGQYLGELARVILVKLVQNSVLFDGKASEKLLCHGEFSTRFISLIEEDSLTGVLDNARTVVDELELSYDTEDLAILQYVCFIVTNRAAKLISICLASLLDRMNRPNSVIAIDGSLFKLHPRLESLMYKYIKQWTPTKQFSLLLAEDGSGKGAGLTAAIAKRLSSHNRTN